MRATSAAISAVAASRGAAAERMAAAEAFAELVPEGDRLLAVLPAQPDLAPFALAEEVAQAELEILDGDAEPLDGGELFGQRLEQRAKAAAQAAQLVGPSRRSSDSAVGGSPALSSAS